jgi:hypothetical protein
MQMSSKLPTSRNEKVLGGQLNIRILEGKVKVGL